MHKALIAIFMILHGFIFCMDKNKAITIPAKTSSIVMLPKDILLEIFSALVEDGRFYHIKKCALVCKQWNNAVNDENLTKKITSPKPKDVPCHITQCNLFDYEPKESLPSNPLLSINNSECTVSSDDILIRIEKACELNTPCARKLCFELRQKNPFIRYDLLLRASTLGSSLIVEKLLEEGMDPNTKTCRGTTLLMLAVSSNRWLVINKILQYSKIPININEQESGGLRLTALGNAAYYGNTKCVQELLKHPHIDTKIRSREYKTASQHARENGWPSIAEMIDNHKKK